MKKSLLVLAAAGTLGIGLAAPASASPYVPVKPFHHKHWGGGFGGYYPGYYPGFHRPAFHPGMHWGGHRIFLRPMYAGSYSDCTWSRVMTPWGPRWRPVCY